MDFEHGSAWWKEDKEDIHSTIISAYRNLENQNEGLRDAMLDWLRLYGGLSVTKYGWKSFLRQAPSAGKNRAKYNLIRSAIDTLTSKIAKNKPRPLFQPDGGNFYTKRKAELLSDFILGQFYTLDIYRKGREIFKDGGIYGTGFIKLFIDDNRIKAERVLPFEVLVDQGESLYGSPRSMFQIKSISKEVLAAAYPEFADEIWAAESTKEDLLDIDMAQCVDVIEAWHLPSKEDCSDGRHVICIAGATLFDEQWDIDCFPLIPWRYNKRSLGFWGSGIAELLEGRQTNINNLLFMGQRNFELNAVPFWWVPKDAELPKGQISNRLGRILQSRKPPQLFTFPQMPGDYYQYVDKEMQRGYEEVGISQMSAAARKPDGINSGRALMEWNNLESERFMSTEQNWEDFYLDIAKFLIKLAKKLSEMDTDLEVKAPKKDVFQKIKWSEVSLDEDKYMIQVYPVSLLPKTPAGRYQAVDHLLNRGLIEDKSEARQLLDVPDIKRYHNTKDAEREAIRGIVDSIFDEGEYKLPDPILDQNYQLEYARQKYAIALKEAYPDTHLEAGRQFIQDVMEMQDRVMAEMEAKAQAQQGPPAAPNPAPAPQPAPPLGLPPQ